MNLAHYFARLVALVDDVVADPEIDIEGVVTFLSLYDNKRKILDRVQANNMKGRIVGNQFEEAIARVQADRAAYVDARDERRRQAGEIKRPEREGREGDTQPMPRAVDGPVMHHVVIKALEDRLAVGIKRYGQPLQAFNGRDAAQDAFEEVLDLSVYLAQVRVEMQEMRDLLSEILTTHMVGGTIPGDVIERVERVLRA